jgi:hypothetical protein
MIAQTQNWLSRAIRLMLMIAVIWVMFSIALRYNACRADGTEQVACLIISAIAGCWEALVFAVKAFIDLITMILP